MKVIKKEKKLLRRLCPTITPALSESKQITQWILLMEAESA